MNKLTLALVIAVLALALFNWSSIRGLEHENKFDGGRYVAPPDIGMHKQACWAKVDDGQVAVFTLTYALDNRRTGTEKEGTQAAIIVPGEDYIEEYVVVADMDFYNPESTSIKNYSLRFPVRSLDIKGILVGRSFTGGPQGCEGELRFSSDGRSTETDSRVEYHMEVVDYAEAKERYPDIPEMPDRGGGWTYITAPEPLPDE